MTVWTVPARIVRVLDADTLEADLDLGWRITYRAKIRLAGINAPEKNTTEGRAARAWVDVYLADVTAAGAWHPITVVSHSLDKYGRVLADVTVQDPRRGPWDLGTELLTAGHAALM